MVGPNSLSSLVERAERAPFEFSYYFFTVRNHRFGQLSDRDSRNFFFE